MEKLGQMLKEAKYSLYQLLYTLWNKVNDVIDMVNTKTDKNGDHGGTWQGLKPSQANESISSLVEAMNNKVSEFVYVAPTGVDDTANIQTALDSLPNGGKVELKKGVKFKISAPIIIPSNVILDGNNSEVNVVANIDYAVKILETNSMLCNINITKSKTTTASMVYLSGSQHIIDNVMSRDCKWADVFKMVGLKESHFSKIRIDNDVTTKTGNIFYSDYSVNNTISHSMIGYASQGYYASVATDPTYGNKSEGIVINSVIMVFCNKAVNGDSITHIVVSDCILDFCGDIGVFVTNGQSAIVSNNWVAVNTKDNAIGIGSFTNFYNFKATNNTVVGTIETYPNNRAFSVASQKSQVYGNTASSINGGVVNHSDSITAMNFIDGGTEIDSANTIVKSGSNANGNYVMYSDGTIICMVDKTISATANTQSITQWTYPIQMLATPLQHSMTLKSVNTGWTFTMKHNAIWSDNGITANAEFLADTTQQYTFQLIAYGRWK